MANHASAKKRIRQTAKRTARNRHVRTTVRSKIKAARAAIAAGDGGNAFTDTRLPFVNSLPRFRHTPAGYKGGAKRLAKSPREFLAAISVCPKVVNVLDAAAMENAINICHNVQVGYWKSVKTRVAINVYQVEMIISYGMKNRLGISY